MAKRNDLLKIDHYVYLIIRKRWLIILPFCLAMIYGIIMAVALPRIYEAKTLILVEPQRVPRDYVQSIVSDDIYSQIGTIKQQILSRTSLEMIIAQFDLFTKPEHKDMYLEDKIENLRRNISVSVTQARRGANAFSVAFQGKDPDTVMQIANALATSFIDANIRVREAQASGTSNFLEDELEIMRKRLVEVEKKVRDYRKIHLGELPEQLETNLRILDRLQMQHSDKLQNLREEKNRLIAIENQMKEKSNQLALQDGQFDMQTSTDVGQLKMQLENLRSRYTASHPDVIRLTNRIRELESGMPPLEETKAGDGAGAKSRSVLTTTYESQRDNAIKTIKELKYDIAEINKQILFYQQRVENTPKREEGLLSLTRDYKNIQGSYNSLLNRKLEAEIAVNMERKQKGEQFRIIDRASLPQKPISPNMNKLFLMVTATGLGIGLGLILMLDYLDTALRQPEEFEDKLELPVIATIPRVLYPSDMRKRRANLAFTFLSITIAGVLFAGFAILTVIKGVDPTLALVRRFISI